MSETIGAALRAARERRQLTLAQVSETTRVRAHYLQALENDDISAMPSAAQARGFLRIYAGFLDLDLEKLIPAPSPEPVAPENPAPAQQSAVEPQEQGPAISELLKELVRRIAARVARPRKADAAREPSNRPGDDATPSEPGHKSPDKKKLN